MTDTDADARATGRGRSSARSVERARRDLERDEVRRFTRHRARRRRIITAVTVPVAALLLFVGVGVFSPLFSVREIVVEGTERLNTEMVHAALDDLTGRPLALVTSGDVESRLDGFVLVQSYATRAQPPSTLVVQIVERQAIGALPGDTGYTVFDAVGTALWSETQAPIGVPALDLKGAGTDSPAFAAAAEVSLALPSTFRAQVGSISASSQDDVTFQLLDGTSVVWGSAESSPRKVEVLLTLITATADNPPSQYDVSSPEAPVTR